MKMVLTPVRESTLVRVCPFCKGSRPERIYKLHVKHCLKNPYRVPT